MRLIRHPVTAVIAFLLMAAAVALDAGETVPGKSAPAGMVSVPAGVYRMDRTYDDDPTIVETWL